MNCANHPDRERAAFCQNCGKPLCTECVRNVGTSVFCEPCLAARVAATAPRAGYAGGAAGYPPAGPPVAPGEPNPVFAAVLGLIPGVGAMYNEQYAKGIVHLMVFALLVSLTSDVNGLFGLFIAGWEFYMVIEAHHTARARRDGTPLPNPFGLNDLSERLGFGKAWPSASATAGPAAAQAAYPPRDPNAANPNAPNPGAPPASAYTPPPYGYPYAPPVSNFVSPGAPPYGVPPGASTYGVPPTVPPFPDPSYYQRIPTGAIWLIGLGLLFMLGNMPFFYFLHGRFLGPLLLIGLAVLVFVRRMTCTGQGFENDGTPFYHWRLMRAINSAFWLCLVGVIWLLNEVHILSWARSWPLYLIGAGVMMFIRRAVSPGYVPFAGPPQPPPSQAAGTEIVPTASRSVFDSKPGSDDQEGR